MRILMTGCCSGFGAYVRERLIAQGHQVYGVGLRGPDYVLDFEFAGPESVREVVNECRLRFSDPPEVLLLNAGVTHMDWLEYHPAARFRAILHVNLEVNFFFCKEFLRAWMTEKVGTLDPRTVDYLRIIATGSLGATMALRTSPGYVASKAGLEAMMRTFAKEFAGRYPIMTATISPGGVDGTRMVKKVIQELQRTRGMTEQEAERYNRQSPLGRNCTYDEVWRLFDFAVNHMPLQMSGEELRMPGGMGVR